MDPPGRSKIDNRRKRDRPRREVNPGLFGLANSALRSVPRDRFLFVIEREKYADIVQYRTLMDTINHIPIGQRHFLSYLVYVP